MVGNGTGCKIDNPFHHGDGFVFTLFSGIEFRQAEVAHRGLRLAPGEILPNVVGLFGLAKLEIRIGELISVGRFVGKTLRALSQGLSPLSEVALVSIAIGKLAVHDRVVGG